MKRHIIAFLTFCGLFFGAVAVSAAPLVSTVLGNGGEIFEVHAGTYAELFPEEDYANPDHTLVVLDVTRPGESMQRFVVPTTSGAQVESSPWLLYSKENDSLNIVWSSQMAGEASVLLARFEGSEFVSAVPSGASMVEEIFFHPEGVLPLIALTEDEFHLDLDNAAAVDAERQILHLVWPQDFEGRFTLGYSPVILLNGAYLGVKETLFLPHVDPSPGEPDDGVLEPVVRLAVEDADVDRVILTFGSSSSRRVTSYDIEVLPMEIVHFGELIRDLVLQDGGFDPADIARFADKIGVHVIGAGHRRQLRSRVILTPSMIDFIATETTRWILDNGAGYDASQLSDLAHDIGQNAVALASSLFSAGGHNAVPEPKSAGSDALVIDVSDLVDAEHPEAPAHVLELRFAYEMPLPDSGQSKITLFTSDDGRRFLASWTDPEDAALLRYVESSFDGTWSEPRLLHVGNGLSLEQAHALLKQRVR